jgi:phosphoserine phosphatase RsbU/P
MVSPLLLIAQTDVALLRLHLREDLLKIAVAVVLLSFGAAALAFFFFRKKSSDLTLVYFGIFTVLYAVRLLSGVHTVQESFAFSRDSWGYTTWLITCTIILPFELFLYQITGGHLRKFLRWLITIQAALSASLILLTALKFNSQTLNTVNSVSVLLTLVSGPAYYFFIRLRTGGFKERLTGEIRLFLIGFAVWQLFVLQANLRSLGILSGLDIEFFGFLIFVCVLAYITASRSLSKEEQLLAIEKELEIARQIQSSTLPREVPRIAGLEIAARYVPMSAVAGDFYDFLAVDELHLGILVADVTGHGVPAALIASMLKVAFAAESANASDPARVLTGLNRALCGKFEEHFVTAVYVYVDLETGLLRYAGAGHPPLLFASTLNGAVHPFEENGLMLGLFSEAEYKSAEIHFHSGDRCLLYTDGLFEAANSSQEEFGKARVQQFLRAHGNLPAARLAAEILAEISRWSGHTAGRAQEDDITLLVLDFQGSPEPLG